MFWALFFLSCLFLFDLLELLSFNELDLFYDESGDDGSGPGSPEKCAFPFFSDEYVGIVGESVGHVCGIGSGNFF